MNILNFLFTILFGIFVLDQIVMANDNAHYFHADDAGSLSRLKRKKKALAAVKKDELLDLAVVEEVQRSPAEVDPAEIEDDENTKAIMKVEPVLHFGLLKFTVLPNYMTVETRQIKNSSQGTLNSELITGYSLGYEHNYHHWVAGLEIHYRRVKFQQSDDHVVDHADHSMRDLGFYLGKEISRFTLGLGAGQADKIFYKSLNASFVEVEKRKLAEFFIYSKINVYKGERNSVNAFLKYGMTPAKKTNTYLIERGSLYTGQLNLGHHISENKKIGLELFYKNYDYKTKQLELNSSEVGLGVSFSIGWGSSK